MLSEFLLATALVLLVMNLSLPLLKKTENPWEAKQYQSKTLVVQSKAMASCSTESLDKISFNENGHINLARTLDLGKKQLVLFLGMGRSEIRKGDFDD